jgi:tetratricopeptide (TPR) repeat protein
MLGSEMAEAIRVGREALEMAEKLDIDELRAHALNNIGVARVVLGDPDGLTDLETSSVVAEGSGSPWETVRAYINLGSTLGNLGEIQRATAYRDKGLEVGSRFGLAGAVRWLRAEKAFDHYLFGAWDDALVAAEELIGITASGSPHYMEAPCWGVRGLIRLGRGDDRGALSDAASGLELARPRSDPQLLWPALGDQARIAVGAGDEREAAMLADELLDLWNGPLAVLANWWAFNLAVALEALGRAADFLEVAARARASTRWLDAAMAYAANDFADAAAILGEMPSRPDAALADLRAAEAAIEAGRRSEGDVHLQRALAFWRSVGATRYVREGEALLAASA